MGQSGNGRSLGDFRPGLPYLHAAELIGIVSCSVTDFMFRKWNAIFRLHIRPIPDRLRLPGLVAFPFQSILSPVGRWIYCRRPFSWCRHRSGRKGLRPRWRHRARQQRRLCPGVDQGTLRQWPARRQHWIGPMPLPELSARAGLSEPGAHQHQVGRACRQQRHRQHGKHSLAGCFEGRSHDGQNIRRFYASSLGDYF